jgi:hypothetical protein
MHTNKNEFQEERNMNINVFLLPSMASKVVLFSPLELLFVNCLKLSDFIISSTVQFQIAITVSYLDNYRSSAK